MFSAMMMGSSQKLWSKKWLLVCTSSNLHLKITYWNMMARSGSLAGWLTEATFVLFIYFYRLLNWALTQGSSLGDTMLVNLRQS